MRQNQFSKLKKAIRDNDKLGMFQSMISLPVLVRHPNRAKRAVTRGQYIKNEINRALNGLKQSGNWSPGLKNIFEIVKDKTGDAVWNEEIYKFPEVESSN